MNPPTNETREKECVRQSGIETNQGRDAANPLNSSSVKARID